MVAALGAHGKDPACEVNMGVFKWLNSMVYGRYKMI